MDWIQLLEDNSIDYVTRGSNTKRGEVSIQCPWCGEDDPSHHLGISLSAENWGCHRNSAHRGKSPLRLVAALLGCSFTNAKTVVGQYSRADPSNLDEALALLTNVTTEAPKPVAGPLALPADFKTIKRGGITTRFWHYLHARGFDDVDALTELYQLRCALTGRWKDRVLIPFYQGGDLIGWTGRALGNPINVPRYLSSSDTVKTTIFNEDELNHGGNILVVTEGPFDALKLDFNYEPHGVRATCVFGVTMTMEQIVILNRLRRRFKKVVVLFDADALESSLGAKDWIIGDNVIVERLPDGIKDPGSMSRTALEDLIKRLKSL